MCSIMCLLSAVELGRLHSRRLTSRVRTSARAPKQHNVESRTAVVTLFAEWFSKYHIPNTKYQIYL